MQESPWCLSLLTICCPHNVILIIAHDNDNRPRLSPYGSNNSDWTVSMSRIVLFIVRPTSGENLVQHCECHYLLKMVDHYSYLYFVRIYFVVSQKKKLYLYCPVYITVSTSLNFSFTKSYILLVWTIHIILYFFGTAHTSDPLSFLPCLLVSLLFQQCILWTIYSASFIILGSTIKFPFPSLV